MRSGKFLRVGLVSALLGATAVARAEPPRGTIEGRRQLQLQLGLVSYGKVRSEAQNSGIGSGIEREPTISSKDVSYGLSSRVGVGLGYAYTENVELAMLAGFAVSNASLASRGADDRREGMRSRSSTLQLIPSVRYVGGEGARRFYVGPAVGFERTATKVNDDEVATVRHHALFGGQLGLFCFVQRHVSFEPGFELYYVRGGTTVRTTSERRETELQRHDDGLRLMLTIGLSVWSQGHDDDVQAARATPPVPARDVATTQTEYVATRVDDLSVRLLGSPERSGTEVKLGFTTRGNEDPSRCEVSLLSDDPPTPIEVQWWLDGADADGALQTGSGRVRAQLLTEWLAHNPSLSVCHRHYLVNAAMRAALQEAIARFRADAVKAGTRSPEPVAAGLEQTAPHVEAAAP